MPTSFKPTSFKDDLLAALPRLRAFAMSLCRDRDRADDLVQEALLKAWRSAEKFAPGSNMIAWLFVILRNTYYSEYRRRYHHVEGANGDQQALLGELPSQWGHVMAQELLAAMQRLPDQQREALVLIAGADMSYEDAARVCGCATGTIKSRVNRARAKLAALLDRTSSEDFAPDPVAMAVVMASFRGSGVSLSRHGPA